MIEIIFSAFESVGVIATILFAVRQIILSRRVSERDSYERLSREYQALLWQTMEHKHLDNVWEPLSKKDKKRIEQAAETGELWGIWYSLNQEEKDCYRFTRSALEVLERAWQLYDTKQIDEETWQKWSEWIFTWSKSSFFPYVFYESRNQLTARYAQWIEDEVLPRRSISSNEVRQLKADV